MVTDSKQTNPIGTATDTSQQDWLELDQQGSGGETLKAKKWTAKSRLVDNSQHIGNIHTGTEQAVELDKSDTLTGDLPQKQTRQEDQTTEELGAAQLTPETSATKPTTAFSYQQNNQEKTEIQEPWVQENEQSSAAQQSGSDPLVFEEHFEDDSAKRSPEDAPVSSPVTQQNTVSRNTVETPREQALKTENAESTPAGSTPPPPPVEDAPEEVIITESSASAPILNANDSYGVEDNAVAINISSNLTDTDGSETLSITIEGVPDGATLSAGTNLGNGTWQLTTEELTDLTLLPPPDSDQNFSLIITATTTEFNGGATSSVSEVIDVFMEAVNDAPEITGSDTINTTEDSMEGFSGYGETWEGDIYSIVTQEEMLAHLGITDIDSSSFTVSLADVTDNAWHGGLQANDSSFSSDTLLPGSANGDETVIQITQEFLDNYPTVDAQVGDFYFDHVDFDKLNEGETADISFSVVVSDGEALSEPQNFNIQVTGSNDAPTVSGSVILPEGTEDTSQSFSTADLLANTTDIDIDATLSVTNVSVDPAQGTLTSNPDGSFTFTPRENYNGKVTISYEVTDGIEIVPATASLELAAVNDAPIAVDDLSQNQQVQLSGNNTSLIADSSIIQDNSEPYTVSIDVTPEEQDYGYIISNGGQTGAASGFFVTRGVYGKDNSIYQIGVADENQFIVFQGGQVENGQQSNLTFTYDGQDLTVYQNGVDITDTGTISIRAGRDLPMQNVTLGAPSNIPTSYEFKGATDNVQIYDSSLSASDVAKIQNGEIPKPDGLLVHYSFEGNSPLADQSGNGHDLQPHGDIRFSESSSAAFSTDEDTDLTISAESLLANDTDVDGDTLSISAVSEDVVDNEGNVVGTASQDDDGNIIFTPGDTLNSLSQGEQKEVNFTYTVSDGQGGTDTADVTVLIHGTNDAPVIKSVDLGAINEDQPVKFSAESLLEGATDVDGDSLHVLEVHVGQEYGTIEYAQDADGNIESFAFVPNENFNGEDVPINFIVSDGQSKTEGKAVIDVTAVNDAPVIIEGRDGHIELSDTTSSNITVADSESINLNGSEDFSISLAVTPEGDQGKYDIIFNKENAVELAFNTDGNLQFAMRTEDEAWKWHKTDVPFETDAINNITFSYDGKNVTISNTNENGETSTFTQSYTGGVIDTYSNNDLMIGNRPYGGGRYSTDGEIDDISMTVNGEEILTLNFDGSDALADKSGHGNDAKLGDNTNIIQKNSLGNIQEDQPVKFSAEALLEGVEDVDGDALHILEVHVEEKYGTMEYGQDADGNIESFAFIPNENFNGEDVPIYFTVSDGQSKTEGKALIDVTAVNDAPVVEGSIDLGAIKEDTEIKFEAADLLKTTTDVDGDNLSILDVSVDKAFGSIEYSTDKEGNIETVKFTPNENFNGEAVPINFVATDGQAKVEGKASIDVTAVNDAPVIQSGDGHIELSDTTSSNITVADSESINLNGSEDFSISLAVTPEGDQGKYDIIFNKENAVELAFNTDGNLQFAMRTEDEAWKWHKTDVPFETDAINNITFSYDGKNVTISNTSENGETSTFTQSYTGGVIDTYSNNDLMIGNRPFGGGRYSSDGEIDNISMTVSGEEVLALQFDGSDALADTSGYGNDAKLGDNASLIQSDAHSLGTIQEDQSVTFNADALLEGVTDADDDKLSILDVSVDKQYGSIEFSTGREGTIDTIKFTPNENFNGENIPINFVVTDGQAKVEGKANIDITAATDEPLLDFETSKPATKTSAVFDVDDILVKQTDDESTDLEQALGVELKRVSGNSVASAAVIATATVTSTDAVIQDYNGADTADLSLNVPSLTLPGEENVKDSDNQKAASVTAERQETAGQNQNEPVNVVDAENLQQKHDLADNDLSHALPLSPSTLIDEVDTKTNEESDQVDNVSNSTKSTGKVPEQTTAQTTESTNQTTTTGSQATATQSEDQLPTETADSEEKKETAEPPDKEVNLSTDALSITLDDESDGNIQVTEQQTNENLDRFVADGKLEQTDSNDLDQFSANDEAVPADEMSSVDVLDAPEAENLEQVEDAGLSVDDGIQEELPQESEQIDATIG